MSTEKAAKTTFEPEMLDEAQKMLDAKATKKAICEFLGITYNTKRLATLLETHAKQMTLEKELRKRKRQTACSNEELVEIIEDYLDGTPYNELSDTYYRSAAYIKHKLDMVGALIRHAGTRNPLNAPAFPEEGFNHEADFKLRVEKHYNSLTKKEWEAEVEASKANPEWAKARAILNSGTKLDKNQALRLDGELVWVPGYQCLGEVIKEVPSKGDRAFRVLLLDEGLQRNVHLPYWDMCSLRHLTDLGVNVARLGRYTKNDDITTALNEALKAARADKKSKGKK